MSMKNCEKDLLLIRESIKSCEKSLKKLKKRSAYSCGFELIQKVKKSVIDLTECNIRSTEVKNTCESLIEVLTKCGMMSFKENPNETVQLSVLLNYCCFLAEEFNLGKEVSDYLQGTYNEWYSIEES